MCCKDVIFIRKVKDITLYKLLSKQHNLIKGYLIERYIQMNVYIKKNFINHFYYSAC